MYLLQRTLNTKITFIQITRPSNKLNFTKLKFFKILKVLELITYKLNLPDSIKIIKIKYVSVLELADPEAPLIEDIPDINPESQKKVWEIKKILNTGLINTSQLKYLIK